jgi:hypothetical protein
VRPRASRRMDPWPWRAVGAPALLRDGLAPRHPACIRAADGTRRDRALAGRDPRRHRPDRSSSRCPSPKHATAKSADRTNA